MGDDRAAIPDLQSPRLRATIAAPGDAHAVQACFEAARDYFLRTERRHPPRDEAQRLLDDAEADPRRAVYLIAQRSGGEVVGVLDLHLEYPEPGTAHIGLLLFRQDRRGVGFGRETCAALESALSAAGYRSLRLSVGDENPDAAAFWERLGFWESGRLDRGVTIYEKTL